jgi:hypothetical protein
VRTGAVRERRLRRQSHQQAAQEYERRGSHEIILVANVPARLESRPVRVGAVRVELEVPRVYRVVTPLAERYLGVLVARGRGKSRKL